METAFSFFYDSHWLHQCCRANYSVPPNITERVGVVQSPGSLMVLISYDSVKAATVLTEWALFTVICSGQRRKNLAVIIFKSCGYWIFLTYDLNFSV